MKILIVNTFDTYGGASKATYRLHEALKKFNINSEMIVQKKFDINSYTIEIEESIDTAFYDNLLMNTFKKTINLFSNAYCGSKKLIEYINSSNADLVHLNWVNNGFLAVEDLIKINKPIVWTMHDNWLFTGGCHIMWDCRKYEQTCGNCPALNSESLYDLSFLNLKRKKEIFKNLKNLYIIGVSQWISQKAKKSSLLNTFPIFTLPNIINTTIFNALDKNLLRKEFNFPIDKKLIIFGAVLIADINKGFSFLKDALEMIQKDNIEIFVFGSTPKEYNLSIKTNYMGVIMNERELAKLYSLADVMIVPSIQESFGQTAVEAMACGTPVVAFDTTGLKDIIDHKVNGYLAKPFDTKDLANGIQWILENSTYEELSKNAREKVMRTFSEDIVTPKYIDLYKNIFSNDKEKTMHSKSLSVDLTLTNLVLNSFDKYLNANKKIDFSKNYNRIFQQIINLDENIIVYGNGTVGKTIQKLIPEKVLSFVDIADEKNHPSKLKNMVYDKIIISVLGREEEIIKYLVEDLQIPRDKIITLELEND